MKTKIAPMFFTLIMLPWVFATSVVADTGRPNIKEDSRPHSIEASAAFTDPVRIGWCRAMGGFPSYAAQARAQAASQKAARRATEAAESAQVKADQQGLKDLGYYKGSVDGRVGPGTLAAISEFRASNSLVSATTMDFSSRTLMKSGTAVKKASAQPSAKPQGIRADQEALAKLGFYKGTVDGIPGKLTSSAVRQFKEKNGLDSSSPVLDSAARTKMEEALAALPPK